MTINMKGKSDGKGTEERRRDLIKSIIESFPARLIFCQEVPRKFETEVVKKCGYGRYEYGFTGKESAVMWRLKDFDGDPVECVSEARTRTAMVKLTSVGTGASFLAVSWHGRWKVSDEAKLEAFNHLICLLREVCEKEKLSSFIIGGDFNFNTSKVTEVDQTKYGVTISRYKLCAQDKNRLAKSLQQKHGRPFTPYKDTFIVSVAVPSDKCPMTGHITVSLVKALELKNESSENVQLDHVPVVGVLKLDKLVCAFPSIKQGREDTSDNKTNEKDIELTPENTKARTAEVGSSESVARKLSLEDASSSSSSESSSDIDDSHVTRKDFERLISLVKTIDGKLDRLTAEVADIKLAIKRLDGPHESVSQTTNVSASPVLDHGSDRESTSE